MAEEDTDDFILAKEVEYWPLPFCQCLEESEAGSALFLLWEYNHPQDFMVTGIRLVQYWVKPGS